MRLATWNVEWFSQLFDESDRLLIDDGPSGRPGITRQQQVEAIAKVLIAVDADAILIVEAPATGRGRRTARALEGFARQFGLRQTRALHGFATTTDQEIALLHDPAACSARHDPMGDPTGRFTATGPPRFDSSFSHDLDGDGRPETVVFSKPPLEVAMTTAAGTRLRLIGVHVKSKLPHGAKTLDAQMRLALKNRRKQLAQCVWLRERVESHLDAGDSVIVLGDLNDGPGLDGYEEILGRSALEVVIGMDGPPERRLHDPHAEAGARTATGRRPATARFPLPDTGQFLDALLDYILVSPDLLPRARRWTIWHPIDNPRCAGLPELRDALLTASDHFPVSLDIAV